MLTCKVIKLLATHRQAAANSSSVSSCSMHQVKMRTSSADVLGSPEADVVPLRVLQRHGAPQSVSTLALQAMHRSAPRLFPSYEVALYLQGSQLW